MVLGRNLPILSGPKEKLPKMIEYGTSVSVDQDLFLSIMMPDLFRYYWKIVS